MNLKHNCSFIVFPKHCNHMQNIIFGGHFMAEMDLAAAHCVRRFLFDSETCSEAVTYKADYTFHKPCYLGDLIDLEATIFSTKDKSIVVTIGAYRNVQGKLEYVAESSFVFISIESKELTTHGPLPYKNHGLKKET